MPTISQSTSSALGQLLGAVGATGNTVIKLLSTIDRLSDAGYSHADTFATNTELRNQGSVKDTLLDEEKRDLERTLERLRHEEQLAKFFEAHPDLSPAKDRPTQAKSSTSRKPNSGPSSAQAA